MMRKRSGKPFDWKAVLTSMKTTVILLSLLMILVVFCTVHQVELGTFGAVEKYMRAFLVYAPLPILGWRIPVFPGGGLVGLALMANLGASLFWHEPHPRRRWGFLLIHVGLILLVLGEFVTGALSVESRMAVEEGETINFLLHPDEDELVVMEHSDPAFDQVFAVREHALRPGRLVRDARLPFDIRVAAFYPNAQVQARPSGSDAAPSKADRGVGSRLMVWPAPTVTPEQGGNRPAGYFELLDGSKSLGTWLVSSALSRPQMLEHGGKLYSLAMRSKRTYLPFSLTLKDFRHDVYPGTNIPKNFSSLVQLRDPEKDQDREVLIYMNHPLRYGGKAFYQSSYGKQDTLSIFQVVENPGWLMPYLSFFLVALGLLLQFWMQMRSIDLSGGRS